MSNRKRVLLCIVLFIGWFAVLGAALWVTSIYIVDILKINEDFEIFGIRGFYQMTAFLSLLCIVVVGGVYGYFFAKIIDIFHSKFQNRITSVSIKLNCEEIVDPENFNGACFNTVDDSYLVIKYKNGKSAIIWTSVIMVFCLLTAIGDTISNDGVMTPVAGFLVPIAFCSLLYILYCLFYPAKKVIFDRINGKVTLPGLLLFPSGTVPFAEVLVGKTAYFK